MKKITVSIKYLLVVVPMFFLTQTAVAQQSANEIEQDNYIVNANNAFAKGQWENGKEILDQALRKNAKDADLRMLLGKYYLHHNSYDKARYELVKALQLNPNNIDAKTLLIQVETLSKRYSSAICYVNELLEVSPYGKGLWQKKIDLYALQDNKVEVERLQRRLLQIFPESEQIKQEYVYTIEQEAIDNRKAGNLDESLSQTLELVKHDPKNQQYYLDAINDYLKVGEVSKALSYTDRAIFQLGLSPELANKKIGILEQQNDYQSLLSFLQQNNLTSQYNHYLLDAARNAKAKEAASLYAKVLERNASNQEAFNFVFSDLVDKNQFDAALHSINQFRLATQDSKELGLKEIMVYNLMGNKHQAQMVNKRLFMIYSDDQDLKANYLQSVLSQAKDLMDQKMYANAVDMWYELSRYEDFEMELLAQKGLYSAFVELEDYTNALNALNTAMMIDPSDGDLNIKKADLYYRQKNYHMALSSYERVLAQLPDQSDHVHYKGYEELVTKIVTQFNEKYLFNESYDFVNRWLIYDPTNLQALKYHVNIANQMGDVQQAQQSLVVGSQHYPDEVFFKVKTAQIGIDQQPNQQANFQQILDDLIANPYHPELLNTLEEVGVSYSNVLLKDKQHDLALERIDQALAHLPNSKALKYNKGLALEKLKQYDQALVYQSFYEPTLMDYPEFKEQLRALEYKSYKNEVGVEYLRTKFDEKEAFNSIASFNYTRLQNNNTYGATLNYTGRESGKGLQFVGRWNRVYSPKWSSQINVGVASDFFPSFLIDASVFKQVNIWQDMEIEVGAGFRKFQRNSSIDGDQKQMFNLVLGATKQTDLFRLNLKLNNIVLSDAWLYNLSLNTRYYFSSSKQFITALAGVGSSPDVELIDYQFYDGFSVLNTNVGLGYNFMLYKNVSAGVMGTWYNYKAQDSEFRNLYNLYFNINVAF